MASIYNDQQRDFELSPKNRQFLTAFCFLASFFYLYQTVFDWSGAPIWNARSDQVIYLTNAIRMLDGEVLYRDIFHFLPPGTETVFLAGVFIFGQQPWIPNVAFFLLGLGQAILIFSISRPIMSRWQTCIVVLAFLGFAFKGAAGSYDAVHHWFSALTLTGAMAVTLNRRTVITLAIAGMLLGITSFITPARGLLGAFALALFVILELRPVASYWRKSTKLIVSLGSCYLATLAVTVTPFAIAAGWDNFVYCTFTFVRENYFLDSRYNNIAFFNREIASLARRLTSPATLLSTSTIRTLFIYLLSFVYLVVPFVWWRSARKELAAIKLIWLFGVVQILAIIPYPGAFRLATVSVPGLILLGWLFDAPGRIRQLGTIGLGIAVLYLTMINPLRELRAERFYLEARNGTVAFATPEQREPYEWLQMHTTRGDYVFVGGAPDFYYLLDLKNPTAVPFLVPNSYMTHEQVSHVINALDNKRVEYVLWPVNDLRPMKGDPLPPLRRYLTICYEITTTFKDHDYQVWQRLPVYSTKSCREGVIS